jgi:hypothetical protein
MTERICDFSSDTACLIEQIAVVPKDHISMFQIMDEITGGIRVNMSRFDRIQPPPLERNVSPEVGGSEL